MQAKQGPVAAPQITTVFSHILSKDECIYNEEIDRYIVDLDVFTGLYGDTPRELSDIIFVTDSFSRVQGKHARNVVPVGTFSGSKKDLTMIALGRYLKSTYGMANNKPVKDVRDKIQLDFKTTDYL